MSEQGSNHNALYTHPPISVEELATAGGKISIHEVNPEASGQLYDSYKPRIHEFPGFRQRDFQEQATRDDFETTVLGVQNQLTPEQLYPVLHRLVNPESYDGFKNAMAQHWERYGLEDALAEHSIAFVSGHRLFTDVPLEAFTMYDIRQADPHAADRNILSVGRMIPGMEVELFGDGNYLPATPLLASFSRQIQTVPRDLVSKSPAAREQRRRWNAEGKPALEYAASTPGNELFIAAPGTHDDVSEDGNSLTIRRVKSETAELIANGKLIVVPLYFSCFPFKASGIAPADITHALLEPRILKSPEGIHGVMHEIAEAGSQVSSDEFPLGVHYDGPDYARAA